MSGARRRLDAEMVRRRLVSSRSSAREAIEAGSVQVDGVVAPKASTLVHSEAAVTLVGDRRRFVGRGGLKLEAALDSFGIDVADLSALDAGASTGGFTDCLLQRGVRRVVALDVGYGQLDWSLRSDPRVVPVERTNLRHADLDDLGAPFGVVVADLSFISLTTVAQALRSAGDERTDYVLLVKPQFEVGKGEVGKGGIVRDPALHLSALLSATKGLEDAGVGAVGAVASPIEGTKGNREFLLWCRLTPVRITRADLEAVIQL